MSPGNESVRVYAMLHNKILPRCLGPTLGKALIVLDGADIIGMAVNDDGIFVDVGVLEDCSDLVEFAARERRQLRRVEGKVDSAVKRSAGDPRGGTRDPAQPPADQRHHALWIERADHLVMRQLLCGCG